MRQKAIHPGTLTTLKKELELCFGRRIISYRDCIQLVEDIQQKTGYTVNVNTLRRFFGLVSSKYTASPSTITILCKYCGLSSMDDLATIPSRQPNAEAVSTKEIFQYFVTVFKALPLGAEHVQAVSTMLEQTIIFLERNPDLIDPFQREIARIPAGQYYYFEQCLNTDKLNDYYGQGLEYYHRNKSTKEAAALSHSLCLFKNWLCQQDDHSDKHALALENIHLTPELSAIQARRLAARLYYHQIKKLPPDDAMAEALKFYQAHADKRKGGTFSPEFELILCEALLLTGQGAEAKEFFMTIRQNTRADVSALPPGQRALFALLTAYYEKDDLLFMPVSAEKQYSQLASTRFNRKYLTLLHGLLHKKKDQKLSRQLMKETGFSRFSILYKEYEII